MTNLEIELLLLPLLSVFPCGLLQSGVMWWVSNDDEEEDVVSGGFSARPWEAVEWMFEIRRSVTEWMLDKRRSTTLWILDRRRSGPDKMLDKRLSEEGKFPEDPHFSERRLPDTHFSEEPKGSGGWEFFSEAVWGTLLIRLITGL